MFHMLSSWPIRSMKNIVNLILKNFLLKQIKKEKIKYKKIKIDKNKIKKNHGIMDKLLKILQLFFINGCLQTITAIKKTLNIDF